MATRKPKFKIGDVFYRVARARMGEWYKIVTEKITSVTETEYGYSYNGGLKLNMFTDFEKAREWALKKAKENYEKNCEDIKNQREPME